MEYTTLGRTGLTTSVIGVGTGGPSRIGLQHGGSESGAREIIIRAIEHGVTFIDTAEAYRTEAVVGEAIRGVDRQRLVLSTKISRWQELDAAAVEASIDERLRALGTDYLDICHLHAVTLDRYDEVIDRVYPGLVRARDAGKIRFIGVTEMFNGDPGHRMLERAVRDDYWDVVMVGFNILNQSARDRVLRVTREKRIGVLAMFAVRLALSRRERLVQVMEELIDRGDVTEQELITVGGRREDPLGWVTSESDADTLVEAAYRFVRHEPGIDVTLSGTGSVEHLLANIASTLKPPLDGPVVERLMRLFARVDSVSAQ